jgi:hypothetical protein
LLAACNGNFTPGPALDDVAPIKLALETVPLDRALSLIRWKVDCRCYPPNPTLTSWRDPKLLKAIAEYFCEAILIPNMVDARTKASAPAPGKPVERLAAVSAVFQVPPDPEVAPAASPAEAIAMPDGNDPGPMAASIMAKDTETPGEPTRESILAAFNRPRAPPQPVVPQPRPPERQVEDLSDEGWEELLAGFMAEMVNWKVIDTITATFGTAFGVSAHPRFELVALQVAVAGIGLFGPDCAALPLSHRYHCPNRPAAAACCAVAGGKNFC